MTLSGYMMMFAVLMMAAVSGFAIHRWYWRTLGLARIRDSKMEADIKHQLETNNEVVIRPDMEELEVYWTIKYAFRHATTFTLKKESI